MAQAIGTNVRIVSWVMDCETVGVFGLTCTLYPFVRKSVGEGPCRVRVLSDGQVAAGLQWVR